MEEEERESSPVLEEKEPSGFHPLEPSVFFFAALAIIYYFVRPVLVRHMGPLVDIIFIALTAWIVYLRITGAEVVTRWPPALALIKEVLVTLLLFLALRNFVVQARYIPSASMEPTLLINDRLLIEEVSKHLEDLDYGEILVFYAPAHPQPDLGEILLSSFGLFDDGAMIKRVIGREGDTIEVIPNRGVYRNGVLLDEPYIMEHSRSHFGPHTVPEGHLFMMGDNRNQSADSRVWGDVPIENVVGRAIVRFFPLSRIGIP